MHSLTVSKYILCKQISGLCIFTAGGKPRNVRLTQQNFIRGDVIGVLIDLTVPQISFTVNGMQVKGFFRDFNLDGMFFPVVSMSANSR